jgi:hypothetical protein
MVTRPAPSPVWAPKVAQVEASSTPNACGLRSPHLAARRKTYRRFLGSVVSVSERFMQAHEALRDCPTDEALRKGHSLGSILSPRTSNDGSSGAGEGNRTLV